MIQRIQSIFLAISAIAMFAMLFLPLWQKYNPETEQRALLTAIELSYTEGDEVKQHVYTFYIAIMAFVSSIISVGSLFSYHNRMKQMKLNMINSLVMAITIGLTIYFLFEGEKMFEVSKQGQWGYGFFCVPVALFCNSIANRFIRKDEKLVRSADRLR